MKSLVACRGIFVAAATGLLTAGPIMYVCVYAYMRLMKSLVACRGIFVAAAAGLLTVGPIMHVCMHTCIWSSHWLLAG